jgi:hypothetical protein
MRFPADRHEDDIAVLRVDRVPLMNDLANDLPLFRDINWEKRS